MILNVKSRGQASGVAFAGASVACPNEERNPWKFTTGTEWKDEHFQVICKEGIIKVNRWIGGCVHEHMAEAGLVITLYEAKSQIQRSLRKVT